MWAIYCEFVRCVLVGAGLVENGTKQPDCMLASFFRTLLLLISYIVPFSLLLLLLLLLLWLLAIALALGFSSVSSSFLYLFFLHLVYM